MVVKDKDGNILQYIEFESLNPANLKMAIKDKDKNLLQTIEINSQTQQTVVKDKMGVVQFTSQIEEDKVIVRDAQGNILKETPKSEMQSQMPDMNFSQLPATSTLPLTLTPYPTQPPAMELPPYLQQQTRRPRTSVMPSDTIPEWNPDFILNSTFTSCCGCNWCGCGGTGGSCVDPNVKCGGPPPPPPANPCNDPCSPPPTDPSGMLWAALMCQPCPPGTVRQPDGSCKCDNEEVMRICDEETKACDWTCLGLDLVCVGVTLTCVGVTSPTLALPLACSAWLGLHCLALGKACSYACKDQSRRCFLDRCP